MSHVHASHPEVAKRLKRAEGHLRKIISMIEEGRRCVDVAQQMAAVEAAVREAKRMLIRDHIDHCLDGALGEEGDPKALVAEFKVIAKYL